MFQASAFRPISGGGFLPQLRLSGALAVQSRQAQAFYPAANLGQAPRDDRGFYPQVGLGQDTQTAQSWYERAKKSMDRYKFLSSRVGTIANKTEREAILTWLGQPNVAGSPAERYVTVLSDFTQDVAAEGVGAYNVERRQNRVEKLEEFNDQLDVKVKAAVQTYGELPGQPAAPGTPAAAAAAAGPDLTVPILIGAGAIALALIL
jgi:hypothetical protein